MMTYKADGQYITLTTTGKTTAAERQAVYDAIREFIELADRFLASRRCDRATPH
jgi:hypothetical protein